MPSPSSMILIAGLALMVIGLLGGGIEVKEIKIPPLSIFPRAASFIVGCVLTAWVLLAPNSLTDRRDDLGTAIAKHLTDVRDVKSGLKQLGMYVGPINNKPELAYFQAVANFQQSRNIGQDGLVDEATLEKLNEALAELRKRPQGTPPQPAGPASPTPAATSTPAPTAPSPAQTAESQAPTLQAEETRSQPNPLCRISPNHKARPSPGVDCTAKGTPDEVEICRNENLCDLDWQLYSVYQVAKASLDKNQQANLAKEESAWVRKRGECRSDVRCIASAYRSRIDQLH